MGGEGWRLGCYQCEGVVVVVVVVVVGWGGGEQEGLKNQEQKV